MSREVSKEAIEFLVGQDDVLIKFTRLFAKSLVNGQKPDEFRKQLLESGLEAQTADAYIAVAAMAFQFASRIKAGEKRETLLKEVDGPPELRAIFSKLLDTVIEESGEHDLQSFAARPGKIALEPLHWIPRNKDMFGLVGLFVFGPALLLVVLGILFWKPLIVLAVMLLACALYFSYRLYSNARMHFLHAHLAPAKIINLTPRMLATYSNLCNDGETISNTDCYVVKVTECDLTEAEFSKIGLGGYVACVCSFGPGSKDGQWEDVHPLAVQTATSKSDVILKALQRIPEDDWDDFDEALSHLTPEQRSAEGLYRVPAPAHALQAAGKPPPPKPSRKTVAAEDDDLKLM